MIMKAQQLVRITLGHRPIYTCLEKLWYWKHWDITVRVAKQPRPNSLETSPEKLPGGVWYFWNFAKFHAKLASVNANRRNIMICHRMTFATAGLLHALFEIVYDPQHNVHATTCTRINQHTHTHTHAHTHTLPGQPAAHTASFHYCSDREAEVIVICMKSAQNTLLDEPANVFCIDLIVHQIRLHN